MSRAKAAGIGILAGAGLALYANDFANMHEKLVNSNNRAVEECSRSLGAVAVTTSDLPVECKQFANQFTDSDARGQVNESKFSSTDGRTVTYFLPGAEDFKRDNIRLVDEKNKNTIALVSAGGGVSAFLMFGGLARSRRQD